MHNNEPSFISRSDGRRSKFHSSPIVIQTQLVRTSITRDLAFACLVDLGCLDVDVHAYLKQELSTARVLAKDHPQCFYPSKHAKKACKAIHVSLYNCDRPIKEVDNPYSLLSIFTCQVNVSLQENSQATALYVLFRLRRLWMGVGSPLVRRSSKILKMLSI